MRSRCASRTASTVLAFDTPTDEPMLAGLTNNGSPSSSASEAGRPGVISCARTAGTVAWAIPLSARTCLAMALSIASAEPSTPEPDVGNVGQLEQALHRAVFAHRPVQQRTTTV